MNIPTQNPAKRFGLSLLFAMALNLAALSASAATLGLEVLLDGEQAAVFNGQDLGCVDAVGTSTGNCQGGGVAIGDEFKGQIQLENWNYGYDSDPFINGIVAVTNLSGVTQQITLNFTIPIAPPIPGGTLIGGSIQGGATDNTGDGVTLSAPSGAAFYTARIDGSDVQTMYAAPVSYTTGASFGSVTVPSLSFGAPIPSQIGPAALTSIGIRLDFLLSAGDSASFTSNFVVLPQVVPLPPAVFLFSGALGLLGLARRRDAKSA